MIQVHEIHREITFVPFHQRQQCMQHMTKDMASPHLSQWRRGRYGRSAHSAELCRFAATVEIDGVCYCRRHAAALLLDLVLSSKDPISMVVRGERAMEIQDEVHVVVTPETDYVHFNATIKSAEPQPDGSVSVTMTDVKPTEQTINLSRDAVANWPVWPVGDEP